MGRILKKSAHKRTKPRYFKNSKAVKKRVKEQFVKEGYLYTLFIKTKELFKRRDYVKS